MTASHDTLRQRLLVPLLALGVFAIINTEMGVVGMVPLISEYFRVSIPAAGWSVTIFALVITVAGPVMPLLFSRFNRKYIKTAQSLYLSGFWGFGVPIGVPMEKVKGALSAKFVRWVTDYERGKMPRPGWEILARRWVS